jgi:hypothetical protein
MGVTYQIKRTPVNYPPALETAFLPCTLIFPEDGITEGFAHISQTARNFRHTTYIDPTAQGKFDDPIQAGYLLLQRQLELWMDYQSQLTQILDTGSTSQYRVTLMDDPITDTGVVSNLLYTREDTQYWGYSFTTRILIEWPITC